MFCLLLNQRGTFSVDGRWPLLRRASLPRVAVADMGRFPPNTKALSGTGGILQDKLLE